MSTDNQHQKKNRDLDEQIHPLTLSPTQGYRYWYRQFRRRGYAGFNLRSYPGFNQATRAFWNRKALVTPSSISLREKKLELWLKAHLTIEGFRLWLLSLASGATVGTLRSACNCPIAQYLMSAGGDFKEVAITSMGVEFINDGLQLHFKPVKWAVSFVNRADEISGFQTLTKEQALEILNAIAA